MYLLAEIFPRLRRLQMPLSRDQAFLALTALNHAFIAIDVYLAHSISGAITPNEWIPILFGLAAAIALLLAGWIALRNRPLATMLANAVLVCTVVVGLAGAYFHLDRTLLLDQGLASLEAVNTLIWAPPVTGPMFFVLIGIMGISAAWIESPPDSGKLRLLGQRTVQMPYSKTRAYMLVTAIFILVTLISSVLDHARFRFANPWVWLPVSAALFGFTTCMFLGIVKEANREDITAHAVAMLLLIAVGVIGLIMHVQADLTAAGQIVVERFLRGSPLMAPLLFCNVGLMGLLTMFEPGERSRWRASGN